MLDFFSLADPNVRYVVWGMVLLGASSGVVGCFTFLRKRALLGDAVAHSVLPGVCLAFMLSGTKHPLVLLTGAVLTGWLSLLVIDWITKYSRIKTDAAIGLTLSVFFGVGILLLTMIQQSGNAAQSGLDKFLFGKAAAMVGADLWVFGGLSVVLIGVVVLFFKEFTLIAFDIHFAESIGLSVRFAEIALASITVLAVAVGIQAVGVVLMAAMLITPAAAARYWTNQLPKMVFLAAVFGAVSGILGAYISYQGTAMPTGPWIVVVLSVMALLSMLVAPKRGVLARQWGLRKNRVKILKENVLKIFYHLGEVENSFFAWRNTEDLQARRRMTERNLKRGIQRLVDKGLLEVSPIGGRWKLTGQGKLLAQRVVRLHRLWELYLSRYLHLAEDHVHQDAEAIEHIITPEIEVQLERELDFPEKDPHDKEIPR